MFRYVLIAILGLSVTALSQPFLTRETHFFGMPNVDSLSMDWFLSISDSSDWGFIEPRDIEITRLLAADFRLVVLDGYTDLFLQYRISAQASGMF